ncbi:hypothetical protein C8R26_10476 [Nitrosomonas oligotropha]|uniref:Uncharacterized protein n=1 Tax=Nitrosomonas oligotropha TaxID=42354 RepID=A0A2T5I2N0_9PROT|nr:hypothetical protein C8R26_10476 [Nitrosomonas oligotropha]
MYGTAHSFLVPEVEKDHTQGKFKPFFQPEMALTISQIASVEAPSLVA